MPHGSVVVVDTGQALEMILGLDMLGNGLGCLSAIQENVIANPDPG